MCSDFKLMHTVFLQNKLLANTAVSYSQDNRYSIVAESGIYVLQLLGLMDSKLPNMSLGKIFVQIPEYAVSSHLGINIKSFMNDLSQFELYEAVLRLDISEELTSNSLFKQQPVESKWSPVGIIGNTRCALASLTNTGTLNIFVRTVNEVEIEEYYSVVNVSQLCIDYFKTSWKDVTEGTPSVKFSELKRRAEEATPTAFTWSNIITVDGKRNCLLIVGHLNGGISIWRFDAKLANDVTESKMSMLGYFKADLNKITALHWQPAGKNGLLIMGDIDGKVKAVCISDITLNVVNFGSVVELWREADYIKIESLKVFIDDTKMFVFIVKRCFIIICLIDQSGKLLDMCNLNVGNFQITGVEHFEENIFLVLTLPGVLKELKLLCVNDKIQIQWRPIYIDYKWSSYRTHGLIISPNKVFLAILISISKVKDSKRRKDRMKLVVLMNMGKDPLAVLMKNTTDSLATYWDCLEILRLDGLIEKKLPCDGLPAGLDYDKLSLIQLKTCLWLAKSSEMMYNKMYTVEEYTILRFDEFKYIVKIKLAINHMHHLLELIADGTELSEFHMQSLDILNMFLKEIVRDNTIPTLGLGKNVIDELYDVISAANELEYPTPPDCMWCKEKIIGLFCIPTHVDSRCAISFMPITGIPYYKCQFCGCLVHNKISEILDAILCPYCDIPLDTVNIVAGLDNNAPTNSFEEISACNSDCLKEETDLSDVENHAFVDQESKGEPVDLLWVSSSEDEVNSKAEETMDVVHEAPSTIVTTCTSETKKDSNLESCN